MKLTDEEILTINKRLDGYHIIYQEIYDEIADHIITAIEIDRAAGDRRLVEKLFDNVIEKQFPGHQTMQKIAAEYVFSYNRKIRKTMQANMIYYLHWKTVAFIVTAVILSFFFPRNTLMVCIMWFGLLVTAYYPSVYTFRKMNGVKTSRKKMSLVKSFVFSRSKNMTLIVTLILNIVGFAAREWKIYYLNPIHYHPAVYMSLLIFFIIYGLSSMRLCRQELRININ